MVDELEPIREFVKENPDLYISRLWQVYLDAEIKFADRYIHLIESLNREGKLPAYEFELAADMLEEHFLNCNLRFSPEER